jgi:hypothetical protein
MKKSIMFLLLIIIYSCDSNSQKINIPNNFEVKNLQSKVNVKGTRVLIDKNEKYTFYNELKRFQKDKNNFFQVVVYDKQDCDVVIANTSKKIDELESKGGNVRIKKKFKLGEYNAYFGIAPQGETEQIILTFGDKTFTVMVAGIYSNNEKDRKEIMDLVLSTYYDKTLKVNIEESLYHTIDLSNSEFKISGVTMNLASYTLGGNAMEKEDEPNFIISTIPISNDFDLKKYSDRLIYKYQNNIYKEKSINITILSESDYKEGESRIIKVEMLGVLKGQKQKIYQFLKSSPKGIYQFIGTDFSKDSKYMNEFKKISENVKLK